MTSGWASLAYETATVDAGYSSAVLKCGAFASCLWLEYESCLARIAVPGGESRWQIAQNPLFYTRYGVKNVENRDMSGSISDERVYV